VKILVLGVTGMLGSTLFRSFHDGEHDVWGTLRRADGLRYYPVQMHSQLIHNVDVLDQDALLKVFEHVKPDLVINCIGLIKQLAAANDPLAVLPINTLFPHRLSNLCSISHARLIHISTDCVYSGRQGFYSELDVSDADDLYGKSKFIGEIIDMPHVVTIRTSIIGHELNSNYALVNWFLAQKKVTKGYVKAIFSGLPTIELANVICNYVIPNPDLFGLYHVASKAINKHDLLNLIAREIFVKHLLFLMG
jgi:dTDP-4-dehydrorhamnose reductase